MKQLNRRSILQGAGLAAASLVGTGASAQEQSAVRVPIKPARLKKGAMVRLVAPASVTYDADTVAIAYEALTAMGLKVSVGDHVLDRFGYFAGEDAARADDINAAFADKDVAAVITLRGGWGAARTLPYLDFDMIANNPKILMGYSDITTLLNAVQGQTGLVTFHGPNGTTKWDSFTYEAMRSILFDAKAPLMQNRKDPGQGLAVRKNRTQTIQPGIAKGRLVGGNLTLFSGLLGTPWFPDVTGAIVFLEEVGEYIYRCDRMLNQLALAGVFDKAAGIVLGGFTDCGVDPSGGLGTFSLHDIFKQHFAPSAKPTFSGAMFGHISEKRTIPVGTMAQIDADKGTVQMLEPSVS